jgi:uncharacterized protein YdhG (YjbR/CyaY superfamily)
VAGKPSRNVDAYIAKHPAEVQRVLQRVRRIIRKALPSADEALSYQIPTYRQNGRYVVYFAGWKRHWSLYPVSDAVRAAIGPELAAYDFSKGTVRFPLGEPVPVRLVERIVRQLAKAADRRGQAGRSSAIARGSGGRRARASG